MKLTDQLCDVLLKIIMSYFVIFSAISFNKSNIKAYYRKATALKSLKKYEEAAHAAHSGHQVASRLDKKNEV